MWEAVERSEGVYDDTYLDKVEAMINKLGKAGIYTLVDAHQDVFARSICGEGVPDFYAKRATGEHPTCINSLIDSLLKPLYDKFGVCQDINSYNYRLDDNDDPLIEDCNKKMFADYYSTT